MSVVDPHINLAIDGDTRTPKTDEYSISLDRQIQSRLVVAAAYIHKRGTDSIAWIDTAGQYRQDTTTWLTVRCCQLRAHEFTGREAVPADQP